jgi:hypothetical protein
MAGEKSVKTVTVKNLVSWAGHNFSYAPGEEIELEEQTAKEREALGLCRILKSPAGK